MHKATEMSRGSSLIGKDDFQNLSAMPMTPTCEQHGKAFGLYCKAHDTVMCIACVPSKHRLCGDIIPLEDAAKNAATSTALADLEETISIGLSNVQSIIKNTNTAHLDEQEKNIKNGIREFRNKINNRLDEIEQDFILKLDSTLVKYRSKYDAVLKHMKASEKYMIRLKEQITEMKKVASDLQMFIGTRQMNRTVHECLNSTLKYNVTDKYNFNVEIDPVLNSLLTEVKTFGYINHQVTKTNIPLSQPKIAQAQMHVQPPIKSISEIGITKTLRFSIKETSIDMLITGCTILSNGQFLIADFHGKKQLMQYNQDGTHVRDILVSGVPFDVTVIDSERVAVSYGGAGYIEILNIKNEIVEKKVHLDSTYGLSYNGGKLYVVVYNGITTIDLSGKTVNTLEIEVDTVWHVTIASDRIYYSDYQNHAVICCDMTGKQIWKFQKRIVYPRGLAVDNNENVIVVGSYPTTVTIISRDGKTYKSFTTTSDTLNCPRAIYLSKNTGDLFVCNEYDSFAALLKVT